MQVLGVARQMGVELGAVALDGTQVHANAAVTARCRMSTQAGSRRG